nr:baseplate J/gp47 family protein [Alkalihalophilus marmarensis]
MYQLAEKVYYSGYIDTAEGSSLDRLIPFASSIRRRPAERANTNDFIIIGDPNTIVEAGFLVGREDDFIYTTTENVTLDAAGEAVVSIRAVLGGAAGNAQPHTISEIINPIVGVDSVTNPTLVSGGRDQETDPELRERYRLSLSAGGSPTVNGIRASVLGVPGVRTATVIENNTRYDDEDGRPPKSIETYVLGGEPNDVAKAIFDRKAAGIEPYGTEEVILLDDSGNEHLMRFSYAEQVPIHMDIEVTTDASFPLNGHEQIRTNLIRYVGGLDYDGTEYTGLSNGQDVIFTQMISIIHQTPGVINIPIFNIGKDPDDLSPMNTITINRTQVAITDFEKVVIQ